jgi:hypothetical protein
VKLCLADQTHKPEVLGLIFRIRIELWERELLVDAIGAAENSTEFALSHILDLIVCLGLPTDTTVILQEI